MWHIYCQIFVHWIHIILYVPSLGYSPFPFQLYNHISHHSSTLLVTLVYPIVVIVVVYMDEENDCRSVYNDDLEEGDLYMVKSDSWDGGSSWAERRPAECSTSFNFGDRLVVIRLAKRWCDEEFNDPFMAVYDNCHGTREKLVVSFDLYMWVSRWNKDYIIKFNSMQLKTFVSTWHNLTMCFYGN